MQKRQLTILMALLAILFLATGGLAAPSAADGSWQWQDSLAVDGRSEFSIMVLSLDAAIWNVALQSPAGKTVRVGQGIDQASVAQRQHEHLCQSINDSNFNEKGGACAPPFFIWSRAAGKP